MDAKLSIVYLTIRPGGIDLLAESLCYQLPLYELIVIDGYEGRVKRGDAAEYLLSKRVRLVHYTEPKTNNWLLATTNFTNAMNSGALLASTDYVVYLHDYTWLPPGQVCQWIVSREQHAPRTLISGIANVCDSSPPDRYGDISIWKTSELHCAARILGQTEEWIPKQYEVFYTGIPMEFIEIINGFDERCDLGHMNWLQPSIEEQARRQGYELKVDRRLRVYMANHRKWHKSEDGGKKVWYPANHNEIPSINIPWSTISPNKYDFSEVRRNNLKVAINGSL